MLLLILALVLALAGALLSLIAMVKIAISAGVLGLFVSGIILSFIGSVCAAIANRGKL